jgi:riboflavin biosynthesis pyrimidine reductase
MRALLPTPLDEIDVHAFYSTDWLDAGGLRVNFVSSADGAAQAEGKSEGLQTAGDNRVFAALRDLADVVLAGAGTVTIEGYRAIVVSDERAAIRRELGLRERLPIAVVSRSLRLNPDSALFADAPVDLALARAALEERGLTRILSEGGPIAFAHLAAARVADELCLSLTPLLVGPGPTRITAGEQVWDGPRRLRLAGLLEEDGALFLRYAVAS